MFNALCNKHGSKVSGSRIGIYVATATRMALDALGITKTSMKGYSRGRYINHLQVVLGLREPNPYGVMTNRRKKNAREAARMSELDVPVL